MDPGTDIEDRLRAVCGHLNVLHNQLVELTAEAIEPLTWQGEGIQSITHWLTWQAGITATHAGDIVRLANARLAHPKVMAVFADGGLSLDQTAIATKAPAYLDGQFAELAVVATVAQLRLMVRAARPWRPPPRPPEPEPVEVLRGWFDDDGRYHLHGDLDAAAHGPECLRRRSGPPTLGSLYYRCQASSNE